MGKRKLKISFYRIRKKELQMVLHIKVYCNEE